MQKLFAVIACCYFFTFTPAALAGENQKDEEEISTAQKIALKYFVQGLDNYNDQNYPLAADNFRQSIKLAPIPLVYNLLGMTLIKMSDYAGAETVLEVGLELTSQFEPDETKKDILVELVKVYNHQQKYKKLAGVFKQLLEFVQDKNLKKEMEQAIREIEKLLNKDDSRELLTTSMPEMLASSFPG